MSLDTHPALPAASTRGARLLSGDAGFSFLQIAVIASFLISIWVHFAIGLGAPLWFDESWTGALASIEGPRQLFHHLQAEAGGPIYLVTMWVWVKLFGISNTSLHIPSLVLSCAAPFIAWTGLRRTHPQLAVVWAVLLSAWGPGLALSGYARCYPSLLCLAIATTTAHIRLLEVSTSGRRISWVLLSSVLILTHYDAALLVGMQGLWLICQRREKIMHDLREFSLFVIPFGWILLNFQHLASMSSPRYTWYRIIGWNDLPVLLSYLCGANLQLVMVVALVIAALLLFKGSSIRNLDLRIDDVPVAAAWGCGVLATAAFLIIAFNKPMLTPRYLVSFEPSFLLMLSSWMVGACGPDRRRLGLLVYAAVGVSSVFWCGPLPLEDRVMNFEVASEWISESSPSKLVFLWENPTALTVVEDQMDLVGGFFLHRKGLQTPVESVYPQIGADMKGLVSRRVGRTGSLIWIFNHDVHHNSALDYEVSSSDFEGGVECRDFGTSFVSIFACRPPVPTHEAGARSPAGSVESSSGPEQIGATSDGFAMKTRG